MARNKEWQGKTGGGSLGQKALFFYFTYGSIAISYAIVSVVILFYLAIHYKATKNIYQYFRKRQHFGICKSMLSTYRNHYLFGKSLIDKFAMFAGRRKEYSVTVIGQEYFDEVVDNPEKGAIILNSHVGSIEIVGYFFNQKKKKLHAIVFGGESAELQKQRDKILTEHNVYMIPVVDGFSHVFAVNNALKEKDLVGMAGDRVYEGSKNASVHFMGSPAQFPMSSFQLAVKLKAPMLAMFVMQSGYKKYTCYVYKIEVENLETYTQQQQIELLMQKYASIIEKILEMYPLQWYNFYDFWKN